MADVKLSRPAQGQHIVVPSTPDARMILDFSADQVNIDRPEGSNSLFFQFGDGASIELQNFYTAYNKEEMPEFQIDGQIIAGTDFFQAFGPDLLPAAGPAASAERGARYSEYANMSLAEGTWHLNELDYRLAFDGQQSTDEWQNGVIDNLAPTFSTGGAPITLGLKETGWDGTNAASPAPSVTGSFSVRDPDGDNLTATVTIGGKTVAVNLTGPTTVESDYGSLVITPRGGGSNITFDFEYTLKEEPYSKTDQLAQGEQVTDGIVISVNDGMGHTVTQPINVVITGSNDAPDITHVDDLTLKDDGVWASGNLVYDNGKKGYVLNSDENLSTKGAGTGDGQGGGTGDGQHLLTASGKIVAVDPDHGDTLTFGFVRSDGSELRDGSVLGTTPNGDAITVTHVAESGNTLTITTDYGTLTLITKGDGAGSYTFTLDKGSNATNSLAEDQEIKLTLHPTVTDNHPAYDDDAGHTRPDADGVSYTVNDLVITIIGSNDKPYFSDNFVTWTNNDNTVTEDGSLKNRTVSGNIHGEDVDGDDLVYGFGHVGTGTQVKTLYVVHSDSDSRGYTLETSEPFDGNYYGTITMDPKTGAFTFILEKNAACVQALDDNDGRGQSAALDEGLTISVPAVVQDSHGAWATRDISIRIDGTNDKPTIKVTNVTVKEAGVYAKGGSPTQDSIDNGEYTLNSKENKGITSGGVGVGQARDHVDGKITVSDVDKNDNTHLAWGFKAVDGKPLEIRSESTTLPLQEEDVKSVEVFVRGDGTLTTNKDPADNNYYGKLVIKNTGDYTFSLNNTSGSPVDKLGEYNSGDSSTFVQIPVSLYANDSDKGEQHAPVEKNFTITIRGSNDAPTIKDYEKDLAVTEHKYDGEPGSPVGGTNNNTTSGKVDGDDVDTGEEATLTYGLALKGDATTLDGATLHNKLYVVADGTGIKLSADKTADTYGELTMDSSGEYSFKLYDDAPIVQKMTTGNNPSLDFNVVVVDKHGAYDHKTVTLTINGSNDAPYDIKASAAYVKDDGVYATGVSSLVLVAGENTKIGAETDSPSPDYTQAPAEDVYRSIATGQVTAKDYEGDKLTYKLIVENNKLTESISNDYGTLEIDPKTGEYTFTLDTTNPLVNALGENQLHKETFAVRVSDDKGGNSDGSITINIKGTNDLPQLGKPEWNKVEDREQNEITQNVKNPSDLTQISGTVTAEDVDTSDKNKLQFFFVTPKEDGSLPIYTNLYVAADGTLTADKPTDYLGELTMDSSNDKGTYTFTLNNNSPTVEAMGVADSKAVSFKIVVRDPQGAYDEVFKDVTLTIKGADDPTVIDTTALAPNRNLVESGVIPTSDDPDGKHLATYDDANTGVSTTWGFIKVSDVDTRDMADLNNIGLNARLHYVITTDNGNVKCDINAALANNELLSGSFDKDGKFVLDGKTGDEANLAVGGAAKLTDGGIVIRLEKGWLTLEKSNESGDQLKYTYTVDNDCSEVQGLKYGEKGTDSFNVEVRDMKAGENEAPTRMTAPVTVTIIGTNDRPTIEAVNVTMEEDYTKNSGDSIGMEGKSVSGKLNVHDVEQGNGGTFRFSLVAVANDKHNGVSLTDALDSINNKGGALTGLDNYFKLASDNSVLMGTYGYLKLNQATGDYTYVRTDALDWLNNGDSREDVFYVRVMDANGAYSTIKPITITIGGNDDLGHMPNLASSITEGGVTIGGVQGGALYFKTDDNHGPDDKLGANAKLDLSGNEWKSIEIIDVDTTDSYTGYNFGSVTATGPGVVGVVGVVEIVPRTTDGVKTYAIGGYGILTLDADGMRYKFEPSSDDASDFNKLALGEEVTITIENVSATGSTDDEPITNQQSITITLKGTNDAPVVDIKAGSLTNGFTTLHDGAAAVDYLVSDSALIKEFINEFVPHKGLSWLANLVAGGLDKLGWLDDVLMGSREAQAAVSDFLIHKFGTQVLIDSDETASWNGKSGDSLLVEGNLNQQAIATDMDNKARLTFFAIEGNEAEGNLVQHLEGKYGTLVIQPDGSYQYILDRNGRYVDKFKEDPYGTGTEKFTIYVRDEHNAVAEKPIELVINVNAPSNGGGCVGGGTSTKLDFKTGGVTASVYEDAVNSNNEHMTVGDFVTVNDSGTAYDSGMYLLDKYTTTLNGGKPSSTNGSGKGSVITTDYGTITLLPNGKYTFTLNNDHPNVQALRQGDTVEQTFTVINGGGISQITIKIHGTNDAPYLISNEDALLTQKAATVDKTVGADDWTVTKTGSFIVGDRDHEEAGTLTLEVNGTEVVNNNGTYTVTGKYGDYTITSEPESVNGTVIGTKFTYTYKVTDTENRGGTAADEVKIFVTDGIAKTEVTLSAKLTGVNDNPVLENAAIGPVVEDGGADSITSGKLGAEDVDVHFDEDKGSLVYTADKANGAGIVQGKYGTLILQPDGTYEYRLNSANPAVQGLGHGGTFTGDDAETFKITVSDGKGGTDTADITVKILGANDAPVISLHSPTGVVAGSGAFGYLTHADFGKDYTVSGVAKFTDVDTSDKLTLSLTSAYGTSTDTDDSITLTIYAKKVGGTWVQCAANSEDPAVIKMGHVELDKGEDGQASYNFIGDKAGIGHINKGEKLDLSTTIGVKDNSEQSNDTASATFTVSITGTNSIPVIAAKTVAGEIDDAKSQTSVEGSIVATDADGDKLTYSIEEAGKALTPGTEGKYTLKYGTLALGDDGKYKFTLNETGEAKLKALGLNADDTPQTENIGTYTIVVKDAVGATAEQKFTLSLIGKNDAPVAHDSDYTTLTTLSAKDVDLNDSLIFSLSSDATYGHVTVHSNGDYHYDFHTEQGLAKLEQHLSTSGWAESDLSDSFKFTATDNHGASGSATASLTLTADIKDLAPGQHGVDISVGSETSHLLFGSVNGDTLDAHDEMKSHILYGGRGDDHLYGGAGDDYLFGGADNDHLYGGDGNDHLYGGAGDDFLDGGTSTYDSTVDPTGGNHLYGGAGNDIMVYHDGDSLDGGAGLDFMLVDASTTDMNTLLGAAKEVEVAIKGTNGQTAVELGLTDLGKLADVGIHVVDNMDGEHTTTMTLSKDWTADGGGTYTNGTAHLTLSIGTEHPNIEIDDTASEVAKFVMTHTS